MDTIELTKTKNSMNVQLKLASTAELITFLKRFSPISGSLLIEIEDGFLKAKTHTPERSVVKSSKIELSRVFGTANAEIPSAGQPILFGVYSLDKLIKSFAHFDGSPLNFSIQLEKTAEGLVGTEITLQNDSLKVNFACATLRLFTHVTDEIMERIADVSSAQTNFVLNKELQGRINSLTGIDSDQKLLTLNLKNGKLTASGKSFDLHILSIDDKNTTLNLSVYKSQFAYLDREDAMVYMNEDRLIFHSIETETKTIIGKAE
jgi:hypothetical protein